VFNRWLCYDADRQKGVAAVLSTAGDRIQKPRYLSEVSQPAGYAAFNFEKNIQSYEIIPKKLYSAGTGSDYRRRGLSVACY